MLRGKKGKEKRRKITLKKGGKALKIHLFGLQTQKKLSRKKFNLKRGGGGNDQNVQYISLNEIVLDYTRLDVKS